MGVLSLSSPQAAHDAVPSSQPRPSAWALLPFLMAFVWLSAPPALSGHVLEHTESGTEQGLKLEGAGQGRAWFHGDTAGSAHGGAVRWLCGPPLAHVLGLFLVASLKGVIFYVQGRLSSLFPPWLQTRFSRTEGKGSGCQKRPLSPKNSVPGPVGPRQDPQATSEFLWD